MNTRKSWLGLGIIVAVYLVIGTLYAVNTPAWQVPDEPAHYNYIRAIAQTGALPVLQVGDYDQAYLSRLTGEKFPPNLSIEPVRYEAWQPPLYYLLAVPLFVLFGGALLPLRLFSLTLGAGIIVFTFIAVHEISTHPRMNLLALAAVGFVAFIPQHVAMLAGVNNDSLSELLIAIGLWLILRELPMRRGGWRLGLVMALAIITKSHAYVLLPATGAMLFLSWRRGRLNSGRLTFWRLVALFGPMLVVGLIWWGRNIAVYGWPDFMATIRHNLVVADQPRTAQWLATKGALEVARLFMVTTFQSFWGQFGWMGVVMDTRVYTALLVYSGGLTLGALGAARPAAHQVIELPNEIPPHFIQVRRPAAGRAPRRTRTRLGRWPRCRAGFLGFGLFGRVGIRPAPAAVVEIPHRSQPAPKGGPDRRKIGKTHTSAF